MKITLSSADLHHLILLYQPRAVQEEERPATTSFVSLNLMLSPQEIERICKAFIRLINAEEIPDEELSTTTAPAR